MTLGQRVARDMRGIFGFLLHMFCGAILWIVTFAIAWILFCRIALYLAHLIFPEACASHIF